MRVLLGCSFVLLVAACQDSVATAPGRGTAVGGTVSGLAGAGLVLQNNGSDDLDVSSNSSFWFPTRIASGAYNVTVSTQPSNPTQTCTISGGSGTVAASDVSSVVVNCASDAFTVGGTVTGLTGNLVLENSNGEHLTVSANGTFAFSQTLVSGASYRISVVSQPDSPVQYCALAGATGTVAGANVTSVMLACATNAYPITGQLVGLQPGNTIVLSNNGEQQTLTTTGGFAFSPVASGSGFDVTVVTQPTTTNNAHDPCTVANGSGTVDGNVDDITVSCPVPFVAISTVCGLSNPSGIFCSGNCSNNDAQYADAYCKIAGYTSAHSYTTLTAGDPSCVYYNGGTTVPTSCGQILYTGVYGLSTSCDAVENLVCQ